MGSVSVPVNHRRPCPPAQGTASWQANRCCFLWCRRGLVILTGVAGSFWAALVLVLAIEMPLSSSPGSPLLIAAESGNVQEVQRILGVDSLASHAGRQLGVIGAEYPLHAAASRGHTEVVVALLAGRADLSMGITFGPRSIFGFRSPLFAASREGHLKTVTVLAKNETILRGQELGPFGILGTEVPLYVAAFNGHDTVVAKLLHHRVDPNIGKCVGPWCCLVTESPLHAAAFEGHASVVTSLLKHKADLFRGAALGPSGCLGTHSPLEAARENGNRVVARLLRLAMT